MQMEKALNDMVKQKEEIKDHHQNDDTGSSLNIGILRITRGRSGYYSGKLNNPIV